MFKKPKRILAVFALLLLLTTSVFGAIAQGNTSSTETTAQASISVEHIIASGSNRLLLVWVSVAAGQDLPFGVTYNSDPLTLHATSNEGIVPDSVLYYMVAPNEGTANVVVTWSVSATAQVVCNVDYTGVDQSSPLDAPTYGSRASSGSQTITISSETNDLTVAALQSTTTNDWIDLETSVVADHFGNQGLRVQSKAGAASVDLEWTRDGSGWNDSYGVNLNIAIPEVVRYVDPDSAAGGDGTTWALAYDSLFDWEAAEQTNLVSDGDWHHVWVRSSAGTADTTGLDLIGWTTGIDNYILIEAADGDQAVKTGRDTARYRIDPSSAVSGIQIREDYVRINGLQIGPTVTNGINILQINAENDIRISNCRITGGVNNAISNTDTDINLSVWNNILEGFTGAAFRRGLYLEVGTSKIYNNIFYNNADGIELVSGTNSIKNNAIFNNTGEDIDENAGTNTIDYNASDDAVGTNAISPSGGSWTNEYLDPANGDFTQLGTGNTYRAGASDPSSGLYTTDMDGQQYYDPTYSVGVDENLVAGYGDYTSAIWTNPDSALTDFSGMIDLSNVHYLWWDAVTSSDGTQGRIATSDGIELAADWIDFDSGAETGWVLFLWPDLDDVDTQTVYVYPPLVGNVAYEADDVYGQYNAYDNNILSYYPLTSNANDRTSNNLNLTEYNTPIYSGDMIQLNGSNQYLELGSYNYLTDYPLSFLAVVQHDNETQSGEEAVICLANNGETAKYIVLEMNDEQLDANDRIAGAARFETIGEDYADGVKYHWGLASIDTGSAAEIEAFVDGESQGTDNDSTYTSPFSPEPNVLSIGRRGDSTPGQYWTGNISNVFILITNVNENYTTMISDMSLDNLTFWGVWSWSGVAVEVIRYVDPDSAAGGDGTTWALAYDSLFDWNAAENDTGDLVANGEWHHVYVRSSAGTADTTPTTIGGWTTGVDNYILVEAADGDQAIKSGWDDTRYRMIVEDGWLVTAITINENYIRIDGLQIRYATSYSGDLYSGININIDNASDVRFTNGRIEAGTGANKPHGIYLGSSWGSAITVINSIITGFTDAGINIYGNNTNATYIYNSILYDNGAVGIENQRLSPVTVYNSAVFNNGDDFLNSGAGLMTIAYTASDDGDGTNAVAPSGGDWLNEFVDPSSGDFTQLGTGNTWRAGAADPSGGLYTTDMEGDAYYVSGYSIGIDEEDGVVGGITQIILPEAGIHSVITGGKIIHALLIIQSIMSNLVLAYVFWQLQKKKNELLIYKNPNRQLIDNMQAIIEIDEYLEGGN